MYIMETRHSVVIELSFHARKVHSYFLKQTPLNWVFSWMPSKEIKCQKRWRASLVLSALNCSFVFQLSRCDYCWVPLQWWPAGSSTHPGNARTGFHGWSKGRIKVWRWFWFSTQKHPPCSWRGCSHFIRLSALSDSENVNLEMKLHEV